MGNVLYARRVIHPDAAAHIQIYEYGFVRAREMHAVLNLECMWLAQEKKWKMCIEHFACVSIVFF